MFRGPPPTPRIFRTGLQHRSAALRQVRKDATPFATPPSATRHSGVTESAYTWPSPALPTAVSVPDVSPTGRACGRVSKSTSTHCRAHCNAHWRAARSISTDPATTLELLKLDAVVGPHRHLRQPRQAHVDGHAVRVLSFDRRQLVSPRESAAASTAGPIATSTSAPSWRWRRGSSRWRNC